LEHPNESSSGISRFLGGGSKGFEESDNTTGYSTTQNKVLEETRSKDKAILYTV